MSGSFQIETASAADRRRVHLDQRERRAPYYADALSFSANTFECVERFAVLSTNAYVNVRFQYPEPNIVVHHQRAVYIGREFIVAPHRVDSGERSVTTRTSARSSSPVAFLVDGAPIDCIDKF